MARRPGPRWTPLARVAHLKRSTPLCYRAIPVFFCCETRKIAPAETAAAGGRNLAKRSASLRAKAAGGRGGGHPRRSLHSGVVRSLKQSEYTWAMVCRVAGMPRHLGRLHAAMPPRGVPRTSTDIRLMLLSTWSIGKTLASSLLATASVVLPRRSDRSICTLPPRGRPKVGQNMSLITRRLSTPVLRS